MYAVVARGRLRDGGCTSGGGRHVRECRGRESARRVRGIVVVVMALAVSMGVFASSRRLSFEARRIALASGAHTILVMSLRNKTVARSATSPRPTPARGGVHCWRMNRAAAAGATRETIIPDGSHR